jgi:hypothetical protein
MINRNQILPTIIAALEGSTALVQALGSTDRIFLATAELPAVFPGVGIHLREVSSKRRAGYNAYKTRDCVGELEVFVQVTTTLEDMRAIEKLIDEVLMAGIPETRGWEGIYTNYNSMQDERLMGISHVSQDIYRFEYTVIDP